jgi:hypothetical protein
LLEYFQQIEFVPVSISFPSFTRHISMLRIWTVVLLGDSP